MKIASSIVLSALLAAPAGFAAQKTVTLDVNGMNCAACPITVKKSLTKVAGVSRVDVSYEKRQAIVIFDDTETTLDKLTRATTDAGYPSTAKDVR
jgi:periplasmic mercuric ion binding protein